MIRYQSIRRVVDLRTRGASLLKNSRRWFAARNEFDYFQEQSQERPSLIIPPPTNMGLVVVPQQQAWVIERFGRFQEVLKPGLHMLIPFVDRIAYVHSLKEEAHAVAKQSAITRDNVTISIDGVLYVRIIDPVNASYGVEDPIYAVTQLAQTTMRSELGKITLDKTFEERESLNENIVNAINAAAKSWGIECMRYEIRDISPPASVKAAMDKQAEAERQKRAMILDSEGAQQSAINFADGQKRATVLNAEGNAEAILARARATAQGIELLASALNSPAGRDAVALRIAEQYVEAFANLAKETNTMILPANASDAGSMVAQALGVYKQIGLSAPGKPSIAEGSAGPVKFVFDDALTPSKST